VAVIVMMIPRLRNDAVGDVVCEGGDSERGIGANRARHRGTVDDIEPGVVEHLAIAVNHPFAVIARHRGTAEGMHGDDPLEQLQQRVEQLAPEGCGDVVERLLHSIEVRLGALGVPADVEIAVA
jgi:hypothetical protein